MLQAWLQEAFAEAAQNARKVAAFHTISPYIGGNIKKLTTFGVIAAANAACSIDAFKPDNGPAGSTDWVVTYVSPAIFLDPGWVVP